MLLVPDDDGLHAELVQSCIDTVVQCEKAVIPFVLKASLVDGQGAVIVGSIAGIQDDGIRVNLHRPGRRQTFAARLGFVLHQDGALFEEKNMILVMAVSQAQLHDVEVVGVGQNERPAQFRFA